MNGKAEGRWLGTSPCDNERAMALRKNALRAYEGKSSELIPPGPRSRVGTHHKYVLAASYASTLDPTSALVVSAKPGPVTALAPPGW